MKVSDDRPMIQELVQPPLGAARRVPAPVGGQFQEALQASAAATGRERLQQLLQKVQEQGESLAGRMDVAELRKYRQLVSDFLNEAMNETYSGEKQSSFDARGRFKEYSVVRKVNAELEKLTAQVLNDQRDNLAILEQLGVIRGLLIDMLI